ncbi:MAG: SAM-dependent chlorinase/fluorinase, partial [Candidatus Limnocylindria bacterium]
MPGPFISFLSDFGGDTAPAVCRGVMWSIAPDARICDLTHVVRRHAIRDGAFLLSVSVPYLPVGVHMAVVDPGVGT